MGALLSKLHYIIILWVVYGVYQKYEEHTEALEMLNGQIPSIQIMIKKAIQQKDEIKTYNQDIAEAKLRIEKVASEIEKLQKQLPSNISDADNLDLLSRLASGLNIKNPFLTPGDEENRGFYLTKKYKFKGLGTFLQFLIMLEKISMQERILNIHDVQFVKSNEKQRGRFQLLNINLTIESYRYNPNFKEDRGIEEIEKQFKSGVPKA